MVLCSCSNFWVLSIYSGCSRFRLFCTGYLWSLYSGFIRLLFHSSFVWWSLLLLLIVDVDCRRSSLYFQPTTFPFVSFELKLHYELIIIKPFNQPLEGFEVGFGQGKDVV